MEVDLITQLSCFTIEQLINMQQYYERLLKEQSEEEKIKYGNSRLAWEDGLLRVSKELAFRNRKV
ncbi:MAG: hypothetical protein ACKVPJ_13635 [Chitinophagales bacterium]